MVLSNPLTVQYIYCMNFKKSLVFKSTLIKTHVIWIDILKYSTRSINTKWKLNWRSTCFKLLGISFDVDLIKMCALNFTDEIEDIKKCIAHWKRRSLTVIGKITVLKSLFLPILTH